MNDNKPSQAEGDDPDRPSGEQEPIPGTPSQAEGEPDVDAPPRSRDE